MITLGIASPQENRRSSALSRLLVHALPVAAFAACVPVFLAALPEPLAEADYVIAGCASTLVAMTVALFLITRHQIKQFTLADRESKPIRPTAVAVVTRPKPTSNRAAASS